MIECKHLEVVCKRSAHGKRGNIRFIFPLMAMRLYVNTCGSNIAFLVCYKRNVQIGMWPESRSEGIEGTFYSLALSRWCSCILYWAASTSVIDQELTEYNTVCWSHMPL